MTRFDRLVYLDVSEDAGLKEKILRALTRKLQLEDGFDLFDLASRCPGHATGADLYALCSDATVSALRREIQKMEDDGEIYVLSNTRLELSSFLQVLVMRTGVVSSSSRCKISTVL